jgi:hypothetical protein
MGIRLTFNLRRFGGGIGAGIGRRFMRATPSVGVRAAVAEECLRVGDAARQSERRGAVA